eukprot:8844771-Heterocapsa_arctica.AAC.1
MRLSRVAGGSEISKSEDASYSSAGSSSLSSSLILKPSMCLWRFSVVSGPVSESTTRLMVKKILTIDDGRGPPAASSPEAWR